jgi:cysteine-rich repeat protein
MNPCTFSGAEGYCTSTSCGDSNVDAGEQCDDGNNESGDGCSSTCVIDSLTGCSEGMVSYWTFDENSGITASDSKDNNSGIVNGGAAWIAGKVNNGLGFDGNSNTVSGITFPNGTFSSNQGSIASWIRFTDATKDRHDIWYTGHPGNKYLQLILFRSYFGSNLRFQILPGFGDWQVVYSINPQSEIWYHMVGTWGTDGIKFYVNGVLNGSTSYSGTSFDITNLILGGYAPNSGTFYGIMDEVAIWNRTLNSSEISALYQKSNSNQSYCALPVCGNGFVEGSEECDDGNNESGDGCSSTCMSECPDGMISYWKGEGNANDELGINNGTFEANTYGVGRNDIGQAFDLNSQYIDITTNEFPIGNSPRTIEAWVNKRACGGAGALTYGNQGTANQFSFGMDCTGDTIGIGGYNYETWTNYASLPNTWYYIAVSYNTSTMAFYVNGNLVSVETNVGYAPYNPGGPVSDYNTVLGDNHFIGKTIAGGNAYFDGLIDEVAIYNRSLAESEILEHYNNMVAGKDYCGVQMPVCGDGVVDVWEECDDGNNESGDECNSACLIDTDMDGIANNTDNCLYVNNSGQEDTDNACNVLPFQCSDSNDADACDSTPGCSYDYEADECTGTANYDSCDDLNECSCYYVSGCSFNEDDWICEGNVMMDCLPDGIGDACDCEIGDNSCTAKQYCSDQGTVDTDCPTCGNSVIELGEGCDDGNIVSGDGCSETCAFEACPEGMVSYWKFDENSGTFVGDSKDNNDGAVSGATWTTDKKVGASAFSFDGANDYIGVPDSSSLDITDEITVSAWIKASGGFGREVGIVSKRSGGYWSINFIKLDSDKIHFGLAIAGADVGAHSNNAIIADTWYHVVGTYNGSVLKVYINGIEEGNYTYSGQIHTNDYQLKIGWTDWDLKWWNGSIDEVAIFNRALSETEIQALYDKSNSGKNYCALLVCGDGIVDAGEECDDGNTISGDGCSSTCMSECPDGMVSYWQGEGNADDAFGNNDGQAQGGLEYTSGKVGSAFSFDGSTGYVKVLESDSLKISGPYTYAMWVYPVTWGGADQQPGVFSQGDNDPGYSGIGFHADTYYGRDYMTVVGDYDASGDWDNWIQTEGYMLPFNQWSFVTITNDGTNFIFYVNGTEIGRDDSAAFVDWNSANWLEKNLYFGKIRAGQGTYDTYFNGMIDEFAVFNKALSSTEVSELFDKSNLGQSYCASAPAAAPAAAQEAKVIATFNLDDISNFISFTGTALELKKDDTISFSMQGESHMATVLEINYAQNTITLLIESNPFKVVLEEDETKQVDVNGDGFNDLEINFRGFINGLADVVFKKIAVCGDNICGEVENSDSCCTDCGCAAGEECANNVCSSIPMPAPLVKPEKVVPSLPAYIKSSIIYEISKNALAFAIMCLIIISAIIFVLNQRIMDKWKKQILENRKKQITADDIKKIRRLEKQATADYINNIKKLEKKITSEYVSNIKKLEKKIIEGDSKKR